MPGRRKITDQAVRDRLAQSLAAGNYREVACEYAGIGVSTFYRWMERGEADHEADKATPEREVWEAVKKAEADAENRNVALIARAAGDGTWQAAAWMLERKRPDRWGRRDAMKVEHSGSVGHDISRVPDDELERIAAGLQD